MWSIAWFFAGATAAAVIFTTVLVLMHRRPTPYLALDPSAYPAVHDAAELLSGVTRSAHFDGNGATILQNGAFFPSILEDIRQARQTVHLETFVWTKGDVEQRLVAALCERAQAGVRVRVLIDALGGLQADHQALGRLREGGAEVVFYCRPRWWNWQRFNHRTHRKLLIVDGRIGYTFGHGVGDQWLGDGRSRDHWRATALRLQGPVVHGLQSVFAENWIEETCRMLAGDGCWPALEAHGDARAHVVSSASGEALSAVSILYTMAIACARREVLIQNPYFAPDPGVVDLLRMMVERGVEIRLMVPGRHTDSPFVRRAGCHLYERLLRAGVRVFEFEPTLLHQKIVVVDGEWAHVGSTNFDARSLALNEEVGVGVFSTEIAAELIEAFERDLEHCHELELERWRRRPIRSRLFDRFAYLLHDQL